MSGDLIDRLRLVRSPGIGPITFRQLIVRFGDAAAALAAVRTWRGAAAVGRQACSAGPTARFEARSSRGLIGENRYAATAA